MASPSQTIDHIAVVERTVVMEDIKTTGGIFTEESRRIVLTNICKVFECEESDIEELKPVQAGLTNVVLSFKLNGGKYVYRHPSPSLKPVYRYPSKSPPRNTWLRGIKDVLP